MSAVLSVTGLRKEYGNLVAVDGISFSVGRNEIVGLLGPNGAGKTTTINMILGVLQPSAGTIHVDAIDLATQRSRALAHTNFAAVYAPLPGNLTVYQNLRVFGLLYGVKNLAQRLELLLEQFALEPFRHVKCGVLSSGEQTRVGLAKAMLNSPRLLLLDEPTASLDPAAARDVRTRIRHFAARDSGGVLWTSHNTIAEYLSGLVLSSVATSAVALAVMLVLATTAFGLSFFVYGLMLVPFLLVFFLFGIALGIVGSAVVLRLGPAAEWFIWPIPALISPFAAVFYPLSTLPRWMQYVARLLPPSYVFESMRAIIAGGAVSGRGLAVGGGLDALCILLACWFFTRIYWHAVRTGLIARYSAESLS